MTAIKSTIGFFKKHWQISLLVFFVCLLAYPYLYLSLHTGQKFYSPDETANFVFIKQFITNNRLSINEPLNQLAGNIILPRSVNIIGNNLVPQSFLGMLVIYGLIGKIIGVNAVAFLTPIISLLAALFFYYLVLEIFANKKTAFFSAILLLINPIFFFTAGKSMLHTNLFLFFLIAGLLFLFKSLRKNKFLNICLSAMFIGLSLTVRTSEIAWIGLFLLVFYLFQRKNYNCKQILTCLFILAVILSGLLALNYSVYRNIFVSGYTAFESSAAQVNPILNFIKTLFLPFGFDIKSIAVHFYNFFIKYLWFYFIPSLIGLIYLLKQKELNIKIKTFICSLSTVSIYLIVFYGSYSPWGQSGQPENMYVNVGAPHLRYWLPIFAMLLPLIYVFFEKIIGEVFILQKSAIKNVVLVVFLILVAAFSFNTVFYNQDEGFAKIKNDIADFRPRLNGVKALVPANSVLIAPDWADRIFWPEFSVVYSIKDSKIHSGDIFAKIQTLAALRPLYYYSASSAQDIADLNLKFNKYDLTLNKISEIFKGEQLYQLKSQ
ncbi:MAG: glycosyltransferase family 39 protein [Parcubacteria group bacterium]